MSKKKLKRRIADLERRVRALEAAPPNYWWQPDATPWPATGTQTYDPCAGCGPVCGNTACPKAIRVTYSTGLAA